MNKKETEIDIVELFEKENELNNEDLKRKVPVNDVNNGIETVPEVLEIINENVSIESAVPYETREMNESTVPNELPVNKEVKVIRKVAEINENKVAQKEEHFSKSEGLVKENIEWVSEKIRIELSNEDENSDLLENDLQKILKNENRKIKLGMMLLIDQL